MNHPSDGRKRAPNPPPDLFSKKGAESTEKYQYRLVSKSIMINRCRIIAWHAFFFFFSAHDRRHHQTDAISRTASNRIESPCLSTHTAPHAQRVAVLWQSASQGFFSDAFLRVPCRHQMIPFFVDANPTHMLLDHRTEISPLSTFKYVVTGDRLLNISRTTTLRKQGPNARRQLPGCVRSQSQISKEKKNGTSSNSALQSERVGLGDA